MKHGCLVMKNKQNREQLEQKQQQLDEEIKKKLADEKATRHQYETLNKEFQKVKRNRLLSILDPTTVKKSIRTTGAYLLGRRNRKQLYSKKYKAKQASNDLKKYKYALYNEGFIQKTLRDLHQLLEETNSRYVKSSIAWELALWYANKQTAEGAEQAFPYIEIAKQGVNDSSQIRKLAIMEAECLVTLKRTEEAKQLLTERIQTDHHPDLFFALANTEVSLTGKLRWINKVFELYKLKPIEFCSHNGEMSYDDLKTELDEEKNDGAKISVILPAYNSEIGIKTAIESILTQTWKDIELIIVDDCSTDNTFQVINAYAKEDDRIIVMQTDKNSGPYVARNIALQKATGDFVTVNDADDWSHAEKLKIQVTHLQNNPTIIANTSEQARLTEDLQFYRRGTPGQYIFSNMSSLMFRREVVMDKIGYWDAVRFAADGEFKRRLIKAFGNEAVVDVQTGPLSLPRQTASSLTGSSAFGYSGFFMGARREYVESFSSYHKHADTLWYPAFQESRLFPVPAPMLPNRTKEKRYVDVMIAADFYDVTTENISLIREEIKKNKQLGLKTGLVQMAGYRLGKKKEFNEEIRNLIDGHDVQIVVYGESVDCQVFIIHSPIVLQEAQKFIPKMNPLVVLIVIDELPIIEYNGKKAPNYNIRQCLQQVMVYFDKRGRWYPLTEEIRTELTSKYERELRSIQLANENWINGHELNEEKYALRIKDWLIETNKFDMM